MAKKVTRFRGRPPPDVRVVHFTGERVADPLAADRTMPWQEYHAARNAVVRACRRHGSVGPMGERPIAPGEGDDEDWPVGDADAALFVLDDQLNHERYLYLEATDPTVVGPPLVADLIATLAELPGWGIGVADVPDGYLLLFATHVLVTGPPFARAADLAPVVRVWRAAVGANAG